MHARRARASGRPAARRARGRASRCAQPSSMLTTRCCAAAGVDAEERVVARPAALGDGRRDDGHGGRQHGVEAVQGGFHAGDPVGAGVRPGRCIRRPSWLRRADAHAHARVVVGLVLCEQRAVPGVAFGGREAAGGLDGRQGRRVRRSAISSMRAPARAASPGVRSKARATVASSASSIRVCGDGEAVGGQAACRRATRCARPGPRAQRPRRAPSASWRRPCRAWSTAAARPSVGTSRAVFLKPTMPHSAAGMRIEPPVSEPRPMKAAPVATDTARAGGRAARNARQVPRVGRVGRACRGAG